MPDIVVRPTLKFIKAGYYAVVLLVVLLFLLWWLMGWTNMWVPLVFLVLMVWPIEKHIRRLTAKVTITEDKLRYEVGLLSKSTRTIQLAKVQDVRVDQSFAQRMLGVGSISIETAGEASRLSVDNIDHPQAIADIIMQRSQHPDVHGHGV